MTLIPGATPHLLLGVACAEPKTRRELQDRLAVRRGVGVDDHHANLALSRLTDRGLLRQEERRLGKGPSGYLYALTPAGEDMLDELASSPRRLTHAERVTALLAAVRPLTLHRMAHGLGVRHDVLKQTLTVLHRAGTVRRVDRRTRAPITPEQRGRAAWELAT